MDESKFEGVTKINNHEFELHNAHCFKIDVPQIGPAQAIYYDVAALKACCEHIKKNHIPHPIVYIMACRIGPFAGHFYREIHKLGGTVYLNPDPPQRQESLYYPSQSAPSQFIASIVPQAGRFCNPAAVGFICCPAGKPLSGAPFSLLHNLWQEQGRSGGNAHKNNVAKCNL